MLIEYIRDADVDAKLDAELRALLSSCFTGEANAMFVHQRFFIEMPAHRWVIRDLEGLLVAHLAIHDKTLSTAAGDLRVGGIAEVCVAASQRGQGLVRGLITTSDEWMIRQDMAFGTLFGDFRVYGSSGYRKTENSLRYFIPKTQEWFTGRDGSFLIKPLGIVDWPSGTIDLRGPKF